jgi:hypothetical protein
MVGGIVAAQALPASAASGKLFVTTVGRDGHAVTSPITIMNSATSYSGLPIWTSSGRTLKLADGHYYVLADIQGSATDTLAAAYVTVSGTGTTKVTLDARKGHLVKATLDGKTLTDYINARICVDGGFADEDVYGTPGSVYAVPSTSAAVSFAYLAQGQGATVSGLTASGVPSRRGGAWTASRLAKVRLTVRAGETAGTSIASVLQPESPNGPNNCQYDLYGPVEQAAAPYTYTELVSPGYWNVRTNDSVGGYYLMRHVLAGHSYSYTYYKAAWGVGGPSTEEHLPIVGHSAITLIAPPITDPDGNGGEYNEALSTVALSLNGHRIAGGKALAGGSPVAQFRAAIKSAGWYTLTDSVTRDYTIYGITAPSSLLSPKVTLSWRFYATPAQSEIAPAFWSSFAPGALNAMNQAKPGRATTVKVTPIRSSSDPNASVVADSVTKLRVWWSGDGVHWKTLAVTHRSSGYYVTVPGLASGNVYLRSKITGSHGDTSTETVYKAYAIS